MMSALAAIIFDFDGVIADCQRGALLPGAAEFIRRAADHVPLGIASGAVSHEIESLLDEHDLAGVFTAIIGADRSARNKPSPDPYLDALHLMVAARGSISPAHTVAIDDSLWGLVAAKTAGLRCVGVSRTLRHDELARVAELVVPGLHTLTLDTLDTLVTGP